MDYVDQSEIDKMNVDQLKHDLKIRREAIQRMLGDINMLSTLLEQKIGKVAYLQYMAEIGQSSQGDIFGARREEHANR